MERLANRTFKLKRSEFPLAITIVKKSTTESQATTIIVGHLREVKNGVEIEERDPRITNRDDVITYEIKAPQSTGSVEIVQTLLGFFATAEKDTARFEITIATSGGQQEPTAIRRPTFNPGVATLKFQV